MPINKEGQPEYPIDLGKKMGDLEGPVPAGETKDKTIYPSLYLEWEKPYNFPDSGTMTVKFKKRSEENRKRGDNMTQRVELDITEITDTTASEVETDEPEESTGDILDKAVKKARKKKKVAEVAEEDTEY